MRLTSLGIIALSASLTLATGLAAAQERPQAGSWTVYKDDRGTAVEYPEDVFPVLQDQEENQPGQVFRSEDERARLHVYSLPNPKALSPAAFVRANFPARRSSLSYDRVSPNFFALSSRRDGMIVYLRCNFSYRAANAMHCIDIRYPASEKRDWDAIVTRISRSLRPLASAR